MRQQLSQADLENMFGELPSNVQKELANYWYDPQSIVHRTEAGFEEPHIIRDIVLPLCGGDKEVEHKIDFYLKRVFERMEFT